MVAYTVLLILPCAVYWLDAKLINIYVLCCYTQYSTCVSVGSNIAYNLFKCNPPTLIPLQYDFQMGGAIYCLN